MVSWIVMGKMKRNEGTQKLESTGLGHGLDIYGGAVGNVQAACKVSSFCVSVLFTKQAES